jgi:hypothetical protein
VIFLHADEGKIWMDALIGDGKQKAATPGPLYKGELGMLDADFVIVQEEKPTQKE